MIASISPMLISIIRYFKERSQDTSKSTTKPERIEKFRNLFSAIYPAEVHERLCDELDAMGFF